jgi:hypothetical protein
VVKVYRVSKVDKEFKVQVHKVDKEFKVLKVPEAEAVEVPILPKQ